MRPRHLLSASLAIAVAAGLAATSTAAGAEADPADGATVVALPADTVTLHVDGTGYRTDVAPDGSSTLPFPTIGWATARAQQLRAGGQAVRVLVAPGTYREEVKISGSTPAGVPLVVEPRDAGTVTVSGADVEARWTPVAGTTRWSAPWVADWGLVPLPASWAGVSVPDGVRRREQVSVDGTPLRQVLDAGSLAPGRFFVDEAADVLLVDPPAGTAPLDQRLVEVGARATALRIWGGARDLTVRGLAFDGSATALNQSMAYVTDATDVLLEGNTFRHSNWGGLGFGTSTGVTVRGNQAVDNGGNGIDTYKVRDAVIEGNTVVGTNQRGMWFDFARWSVAGSKHLHLHDAVLRGNTYRANWTRGLWLDTDVADVLVDGDRSTGNLRDGVFIEAVQGPITLRGTTWSDNGQAGVLVGTSGGVTIEQSTMSGNGTGQLVFAGDRQRSWTDHETGAAITMGDFADWVLRDTVLTSTKDVPVVSAPVIPLDELRTLLRAGELRATGSVWTHPAMGSAIKAQGGAVLSIAEWNQLTGDAAPTGTTTTTSTTSTTTSTTTTTAKPTKGGGGETKATSPKRR